MDWKSLIINKAAVKRIFYIYIPVLLGCFVALTAAAFLTTAKASPPLDLAQDFKGKLPIVYSDNYNIEFFGLEKAHPFDSVKYRRVMDFLLAARALKREQVIPAAQPGEELLLLAHSREYLDSLKSPWTLARITEMHFLRMFPAKLAYNIVLATMLFQTGGSLLAAKAALGKGWAINLGGGFHHASYANGQGFCPLADISLIVKYLRREKLAQKVMIIDLDAHQGNGHGRDFIGDADVFIVDVYNSYIYPGDTPAKEGIDLKVELEPYTADTEFLQKTRKALDKAFAAFASDLVIYNAGTDILIGDELGALDITREGVIKRDELVFEKALGAKIPVVMLLSGGYQKSNAEVIAASILNLKEKFGLF